MTLASLQEENGELTKKVISLENKLKESSILLKRTTDGHTRSRKHSLDREYSPRQRARVKKQRTASCAASLRWMTTEGYTPVSVIAMNTISGCEETISLHNHFELALNDKPNEEEENILAMMLYVKDRFSISGAAYHEMGKVCREMPRQYKIKHKIAELNKMWNIQPIPSEIVGVQQSLEPRLRSRIQQLERDTPEDAPFKRNRTVQVKLSGDSTNMGKRIQVENFTYTLLDEGEKAYSYEACHPLAMFKAPEKYDTLKLALKDLIAEITTLTSIIVDDKTYTINYYLGGDWKFLALVTGTCTLIILISISIIIQNFHLSSSTGIDSASSQYSCIWCKCSSKERYNPEVKWSVTDGIHGARSTQENITLAAGSKKKFNVSNPPIFPSIPLQNVVIDNLHLFLRVSDVLIDLLIMELKRQDSLDKVRAFSNFDIRKHQHIERYQQFIVSLGISGFQFYVGRTSNKLKCRSLTGTEKLKVFRAIRIIDLLPSFTDATALRIQKLWNDFFNLHQTFCKRPKQISPADIKEFDAQARQWGALFIRTYHDSNVTPYIHALMNHVSEFMTLHGSIAPFTQQGLEKYNDVTTKDFFRSTNHKGESALRQIMEKQNRLEYLRCIGTTPKKAFNIKCSICHTLGHNKLTCQERHTLTVSSNDKENQ